MNDADKKVHRCKRAQVSAAEARANIALLRVALSATFGIGIIASPF